MLLPRQQWPDDWQERRHGRDCPLCLRRALDNDEWGTQFCTGRAADGFMWKTGQVTGYVVAVWNGRHAAEPTELTPLEGSAYWSEVTGIGRAWSNASTSPR